MKNRFKIICNNKKAYFSYLISGKFVAGIQLKGAEIKSIRIGNVNINESYCLVKNDEIWIKNIDITRYKFCQDPEYVARRDRKLLLNQIEIKKIKKDINEKGMSLVPTKLVINEKGFAKLELGIGKGKKLFDKRQAIKKRDAKMEIARKKKGEINSPNFKKMSSD